MDPPTGNKELHPISGSIIPHLLLLVSQVFFLAGPRSLPFRKYLATTTILGLAVLSQFNRFTNNPGLANLFALAWPHWLSAVEKTVFASSEGPEHDFWPVDKDPKDVLSWHPFSWRKIKWAIVMLFNLRGIRWSYQVKNLPQPRNLDRMTRWQFIRWRSKELAFVLLMVDLISQMMVRLFYTDATGGVGYLDSKRLTIRDDRILWSLLKTLTYGLGPYFFINMQYLVVSILAVSSGVSNASDWPPLFGKLKEATTMRKFWGIFWHQMLRRSLSTITSNLVDAMGIRRGTNASAYLQLWLAFSISGVMHGLSQLLMPFPRNITPSEVFVGIFVFFPFQAAAITLEDFVIWLWKSRFGSKPRWWAPIVGYMWVIVAFWMTLAFPGTSMLRMKLGEVPPLPYTLVGPFLQMIL